MSDEQASGTAGKSTKARTSVPRRKSAGTAKAGKTAKADGKTSKAKPAAKSAKVPKLPRKPASPARAKRAAPDAAKAAVAPKTASATPKAAEKPAAAKKSTVRYSDLLNPMVAVSAYTRLVGKALNRMVPEVKSSVADLVEQIEKGPQGPHVLAAFDFDGTLVGGYTGAMFFKERRKRKDISREEMLGTLAMTVKTLAKLVETNEMVSHAFSQWSGKSEAEMEELGALIYENAIQDSIFPEMRELLAAHRKAGHTLVVATSASRFQVEPAVKALGIDNMLCSQLEAQDGVLTGQLVGGSMFGQGKADAIRMFAEERGLKLSDTHFYADGSEEVGLMKAVGHPHPVNPGSDLADAAKTNKWPVLRLSSRGGSKPSDFLRTFAGLATLGPILQAGLAVGALSRDKRTVANMVLPTWVDQQFRMAGVKLRVVGRKHVRAQRPAVFIFNHRNYLDAMIAGALVRTDYAGVARKTFADNPIGKLIQKLVPTVLIERGTGDKEYAAKALQPVVDAMRNEGYSIMLSPEGTRVRGNLNSVGPFKKGAFHMAMAGGVPVVPIVIRNALDIASHGAGTIRPGTVDVAVLPPISVADWTAENLGEKVEEVRQMYIHTLNNWPQPDETEAAEGA